MYEVRLRALVQEQQDIVRSSFNYFCLIAPGEWRVINAVPLRRLMLDSPESMKNTVMSLRLSTGIIGSIDCPSGDADHAPKGNNEVIIGIGEDGIKGLLELGALPCISCHSGSTLQEIAPAELTRSLDSDLQNANDVNYLIAHYDARRLHWSEILALGISPCRFYTRPNLMSDDITAIRFMFKQAGLPVPEVGYYDRTREDRFFYTGRR